MMELLYHSKELQLSKKKNDSVLQTVDVPITSLVL